MLGRLAVRSRQKPGGSEGPERNTSVELPNIAVQADKEITIPVTVTGIADKDVISYEFDLRFDPSVMQPQINTVDLNGTVSRGLAFVTNKEEPGRMRVVMYGPMPIDGDGVLLNLRFIAVGKPAAMSPLIFESFMFNEGLPMTATEGKVELF